MILLSHCSFPGVQEEVTWDGQHEISVLDEPRHRFHLKRELPLMVGIVVIGKTLVSNAGRLW